MHHGHLAELCLGVARGPTGVTLVPQRRLRGAIDMRRAPRRPAFTTGVMAVSVVVLPVVAVTPAGAAGARRYRQLAAGGHAHPPD